MKSEFNFSKSIFKNSYEKKVKKGQLLLCSGDASESSFYVQQGCLRAYTIDSKGKEHIFQFAPEDWIVGDQEAMFYRLPATYNIDALEDSVVRIIKRPENNISDLDKETLAEMNLKFLKRILALQSRVMQLLSYSAEERYAVFNATYPDLVQRVPQKMIASYLGITPEGLSRVRKKIAAKH